MSIFPQRLRKLRQLRGWKQKDVAERLGITESAYGYYEQGRREAPHETLLKLAELFDVKIDYLLGRESTNHENIDPEWSELYDEVKRKGAELEATTLLRSATRLSKRQLKDIIRIFEMIEKEEDE